MSGNRLTIFDTTLRDGEQAPGFSLRIDEKLALARQLARSAWTSSRPASRLRRRPTPRPSGWSPTHVQGPVIAALARCHARDIERAAWALAPAPRRRIHIFIATSDLHLERKLRMSREECLADRDGRGPARAESHRRRAVLGRGRDAQRSGLPLPDHRGGDPGRREDDQPARHGRLLDAGRSRALLPLGHRARAELRPGDVQRALPRRSRPGGRQHARGDRRRRAAGRVHDQRDRRARGQRVARRDRHGDPRARRSPAVPERHRHAGNLRRRASC